MLRKIRITLATIFIVAITMLFLDFTGTLHAYFGWMAKVQFLPALIGLNIGILVLLVALTLLFGRIYCSVICPLGVFQDVISWLSARRKKYRRRFYFSKELAWLRYAMLVVSVILFFLGALSFIAPYSAYGRMAHIILSPAYVAINNILADYAAGAESYAFYHVSRVDDGMAALVVSIVTLVILVVLAWRGGRTYCNTICPVGTVLGYLARYSWLKPVINESKCSGCTLCEKGCKSSCIDVKNHKIDYTRCVTCGDCLKACNRGALTYAHVPCKKCEQSGANKDEKMTAESGEGRRQFLGATVALATAAVLSAEEKHVDGGLAVIEEKKIPRHKPMTPAGSKKVKLFYQNCTACQLCITVCPNKVLRPSTKLETLMKPEMHYNEGFCRPECVKCAEACPTAAIKPITVEEKTSIQIGVAKWHSCHCVINTDGVECGNCARHCPNGAIKMMPQKASNPDGPKMPVINKERCIGCGACEYVCPSRPFSAIIVQGLEVHRDV